MVDYICMVFWSFSWGTSCILLIRNDYSLGLFDKHLLRAYDVPGTFPSMGTIEINKIGKVAAFAMFTCIHDNCLKSEKKILRKENELFCICLCVCVGGACEGMSIRREDHWCHLGA